MDPHLVEDTLFTSQATPHPTKILTQTLDTPTVYYLATVMAAPSPDRSWQEVTNFNLMKLKCFMKLLERNEPQRYYSCLDFCKNNNLEQMVIQSC